MPARTQNHARRWLAAAAALAVGIAVVAFRSGEDAAPPAPAAPQAPAASGLLASVPPSAAPLASAAPAAVVVAMSGGQPLATEDEIMGRLRADVDATPEAALALADEGDQRYPAGRYADERAYLKMRAMVHLGQIAIARDVARQFYERHPDSPLGRFVFRLTGMRPMPPLGPPR